MSEEMQENSHLLPRVDSVPAMPPGASINSMYRFIKIRTVFMQCSIYANKLTFLSGLVLIDKIRISPYFYVTASFVLFCLFQTEKPERRHTFASLALRKRYSYLTDPAASEFAIFTYLKFLVDFRYYVILFSFSVPLYSVHMPHIAIV